ncbi:DUF3997 domain-containing protein [Pedobacter alpinus]|uniref:DUF3997 domain-containing protein n=1 Tax=Pedobacter alpinus TaxID=1590643 RepID=A0ABW5TQR4_9SPHI
MKAKLFFVLFNLASCSVSDYTEDLGNEYSLVSESKTIQFITGPNDSTFTGLVPCTVESFASDDFYIIAKQRNNPGCSNLDLSSLSINYWIIDKKREKVYGPLDSLSFNRMRKGMSISNSLKLF